MKRIQVLPVAALTVVGVLAGCSGGGGGGSAQSQSSLTVSLMDAPVDGVTAVYVKITAMWIKPQGNGAAVQLPMPNGPMTVNLMGLTDKNAAILVDGAAIKPGSYDWIEMQIAAEPNVRDSYVITTTGAEQEVETDLSVPSGRMRLVGGFTVPDSPAVKLLFDWDMRQGLVYPPGKQQYFLKPAFRMIDVTAAPGSGGTGGTGGGTGGGGTAPGVLQGTIAAAVVGTSLSSMLNVCAADSETDLDVGNVVYVFSGAGVTPDDIDGTGDPITTVTATRNAAGDYVYSTPIAPGTYSVTFTCQAANDDPLFDETGTAKQLVFAPEVDITNTGGVSIVDFSAAFPPPTPR